jgi:hypothetical protein
MTNPFRDQARFMRACNQPTGAWSESQFNLYTKLIQEETDELWVANAAADNVDGDGHRHREFSCHDDGA